MLLRKKSKNAFLFIWVMLFTFSSLILPFPSSAMGEQNTSPIDTPVMVVKDTSFIGETTNQIYGTSRDEIVLNSQEIDDKWVYFAWGDNEERVKVPVNATNLVTDEYVEKLNPQNDTKGLIQIISENALLSIVSPDSSMSLQLTKGQTLSFVQEDDQNYIVVIGSRIASIHKQYAEEIQRTVTENDNKSIVEEKQPVQHQSVITSNNNLFTSNYFKVVRDEVGVFENRDGKLIEVGKMYKGQVYPRTKDAGANWHEIQFGKRKAFVHKPSTVPANGSEIKNKSKLSSYPFNMTITNTAIVYDNTSGSLVPYGVINSDISYSYIAKEGNWFKIDFSGRTGFIHESYVKANFTDQIKYFEVQKATLPIFENRNGKLIEVGKLYKGQIYPRIKDEGANWHKIQFSNRAAYVHKPSTIPASGNTLKNISSVNSYPFQMTTTKDAVVNDNTSGNLIPYGEIKQGQTYKIISDMGPWLKVDLSGRTGYIHESLAKVDFTSNVKYFKANDSLPVFDNSSGSLVQVGTLLKNQQYPRIREYGTNWHEIKFGSGYGYVAKAKTTPVLNPNIRNLNKGQKPLSIKGKILQNASVYDNTSGSLVAFANLNKGISYPLLSNGGNWVSVDVAGRIGHIHKTAIQVTNPDVVNPNRTYTYDQMIKDINTLAAMYPGLITKKIIGTSVDGRYIYAVKLGKGQTEIFLNGSHHAREHMTTNVLMEMIDEYSQAYINNSSLGGYSAKTILDRTSVWFVPMVNPDGVTLVQKGRYSSKNPSKVLALNGFNSNFSAWKANIRGVDLNRQYPADWSTIKNNTGEPGPKNFKGYSSLSEPEAKAIVNFTNAHAFKTAISYHSSGEILYWYFKQQGTQYSRDLALANMIKGKTGYSLVKPTTNPSGGGYTDWFIQAKRKPGFTPEISPYVGERPVPQSNYQSIWNENYTIGLMMADEAYKNRNTR